MITGRETNRGERRKTLLISDDYKKTAKYIDGDAKFAHRNNWLYVEML